MRRIVSAAAAALMLVAVAVSPSLAAAPPYTVIASGLHDPRGLALAPNGRNLYVAEAGLGDGSGSGLGYTGSITAIRHPKSDHPTQKQVITGIVSAADAEGAIGIDGIAVRGDNIFGIIGLNGAAVPGTSQIGRLVKFERDGDRETVANVGDFNYAWSNAHKSLSPRDFPDANPYGITEYRGKSYVVDAGTNTLDVVEEDGHIRVLAFFPDNALADSTPTCVAKGPDGALYVGTLALADSAVKGPSAQVYRVDLRHATGSESSILNVAKVWASGLWPINGCAFGPDGSFYASQMFTGVTMGPNGPEPTGGDVVRIPFRHPSQHISLTGGTLPWAAGVAVDRWGTVYAVGGAVFPNGFVVRINR